MIHEHFDQIDQKWRQCFLCKPRYHPENELVKKNGVYYCTEHYHFTFDKRQQEAVYIADFEDGEE